MSLRSISLIAFALLLNVPTPVNAADVVFISPYNRRTVTSRQPLVQQPTQQALSKKEQQLEAYRETEEGLLQQREEDAKLPKKESNATADKKTDTLPPPAKAPAAKAAAVKTPTAKAPEPENKNFGPIGGLGPVGGIGAIGPN